MVTDFRPSVKASQRLSLSARYVMLMIKIEVMG